MTHEKKIVFILYMVKSNIQEVFTVACLNNCFDLFFVDSKGNDMDDETSKSKDGKCEKNDKYSGSYGC